MHFLPDTKIINIMDGKPLRILETDANGRPIPDTGPEMTVGMAILESLLAPAQNSVTGVQPSHEEKLERWLIAVRVKKGAPMPVELTGAELTVVKKLVSDHYASPMVVGQVLEALTQS